MTIARIRVGVDGLAAKGEGALTYLGNLLPELAALDGADVVVYANRIGARWLRARLDGNARIEEVGGAERQAGRLLAQLRVLGRRVRRDGIDVLFHPAPVLPAVRAPATVVALRNMEPYCEGLERRVPRRERLRFSYLRAAVASALRNAERIILVAEGTRPLLERRHRLPVARTVVIPHGRNPMFRPMPKAEARMVAAERWGLRDPFVLYVSKTRPYKNHIELVRAFALLRRRGRTEQLVIAGERQEPYASLVAQTARETGVGDSVRFLGDVRYEDLPALNNACEVFVYPSTCEACPNIVIEALGCGIPMAVSSLPVIRELCGEAAAPFDANEPESIARTLWTLLADERARVEYGARAARRAEVFSWRRTAERTLEVLSAAAVPARRSRRAGA